VRYETTSSERRVSRVATAQPSFTYLYVDLGYRPSKVACRSGIISLDSLPAYWLLVGERVEVCRHRSYITMPAHLRSRILISRGRSRSCPLHFDVITSKQCSGVLLQENLEGNIYMTGTCTCYRYRQMCCDDVEPSITTLSAVASVAGQVMDCAWIRLRRRCRHSCMSRSILGLHATEVKILARVLP